MKRFTLALCIGIGLIDGAAAQDAARRAPLDAMQAAFSVCVAYYSLELKCSDEASLSAKFARVAERSNEAARVLGMPVADVALRLELDVIIETSLTPQGCANVRTLRSRYDLECDPLAADDAPK
jgi:hypothetical protein